MMVSLRAKSVCALALSSAWLLLAAQAMGQPRFRVTNLGSPPGGSASYAYGMNAKGQTVGEFLYDYGGPDQANHAFVWLPEADYGLAAGMHDLTILANLAAPGKDGIAFDINDDGVAVGRQAGLSGIVPAVVFVWDLSQYPNAGWAYDLGSLGSGGSWDRLDDGGSAYAVNNADPAIVVGQAGIPAVGFQVTLGPSPDLENLFPIQGDEPVDDESCGFDVNMRTPLLAVGTSNPGMSVQPDCYPWSDAVRWQTEIAPGPAEELPAFEDPNNPPDFSQAIALGANEAGLIVGWGLEQTDNPELTDCMSRALFWWEDAQGVIQKYNLGALVTGSPEPNESEAEAIRNTIEYEPLQVVGADTSLLEALLWERDGGNWTLAILNDEIGDCYPEWVRLRAAKDINDSGWITGWGRFKVSGVWEWRAYVLTHPGDCPEDVTGDGQVNIDDLFAVLGHWGDPVPGVIWIWDVNFDCVVDIDDIFAINTAWGPCGKDGGGAEGLDLAIIFADWLVDGGAAALDKGLITWDDIGGCLKNDSDAGVEACLYDLLKE